MEAANDSGEILRFKGWGDLIFVAAQQLKALAPFGGGH
jgi:hypothetical protein